MAIQIKNKVNGVTTQPDFTLTEKNDGTIEGSVDYVCSRADLLRLPQIGSLHPAEKRAECYNRDFTFMKLDQVKMTASYFGLITPTTNPIISYSPNTDKEPIDTHPEFSDFAGTKASPKNGAKFDPETGEFLGFYDPDVKDLFGARHYLVPSTMVSLSYWTSNAPSLGKRMSIVSSIPGFRKPSDVKNFLLLDIPYRQVGTFYQMTKQYLGSGPGGFSEKLYK